MKRYTAEFVGTYILVFAGTAAIVVNDISSGELTHLGVSIVFGLAVASMIYAFGDVSGAHLNPAVTIAFWFARRFSGGQVLPYVVSQLLGALAASGTVYFLFGDHATLGATLPAGSSAQSFVLEAILTFILMLTIVNVATGANEKGLMAGAAIGGVVAMEALFGGPISGASMNPARSIAPALVSGHIDGLWIYVVAPILGSCLAIMLCRCVREDSCCR